MLKARSQQIRESLKHHIAIVSMSVAALEEQIAVLESELNSLSHSDVETDSPPDSTLTADEPWLDVGTLSVEYQGRRCRLGNSLKFKLLARLLRCPNRYVSYDTLLTEVWTRVVDTSSIRSVVKDLRALLRAAGMASLADAIDGRVTHHYGIILNRL